MNFLPKNQPKFRIFSRSALSGFLAILLLAGIATAGSLTPPGAPGSTMNTLAEIYDTIAGAFDSTGVVADQNGSLIEHLKYIEENMPGGVASDSLDFDEFVDNMTLDADTTITNNGFSFAIQNASISNDLEVRGTASVSRMFFGPSSASYALGATQLNVSVKVPTAAIGTVAISSDSRSSLYIQGRYAYLAGYTSATFQILDISNPAAPVVVSTVTPAGQAIGVFVQGRYAYLGLDAGNKLQIFDVSNPAAPVAVGVVGTDANPRKAYVQGRYAYVPNANGGTLQVIDVANPAAPVVVSTVPGLSSPHGTFVQGKYVYIANRGTNIFQIFDASNPAALVSVGSLAVGTSPVDIYVQGRYAYLVENNGTTGLRIIDISNPQSPVSVSTIDAGSSPFTVSVQGRYAYVAGNGTNPVQIFDVSNPAAPVRVGLVPASSGPRLGPGLVVQGRYLYVINNIANTLQVFDLGGAYIQQFEAGGIEGGTLSLRNSLTVFNDADVRGGMVIGRGLQVTGPFSVTSSISGFKTFTINPNGTASISGTFGPTTTNAYDLGSPNLKWRNLYVQNLSSGASISGNFDPSADNTYDLGEPARRWRALYLGPGSLHISSTTGTSGAGSNYTDGILQFTSGSSLSLGTTAVGTGGAGSLELRTGNTARLFVSSGGHVGIGTTDPADAALVVHGGILSNSASIAVGSYNEFIGTYHDIATNWDDYSDRELRIQSNNSGGLYNQEIIFNGRVKSDLSGISQGSYGRYSAITFVHAGDIQFRVNPGAAGAGVNTDITHLTALIIKNTGNVGIGTSSPTTKLSIVASAGNYDVLNVASSSGTSLFRITKSGNVGVGTTTPITQLHVPGRVPTSVAGSVATGTGPESMYVQGRYAYVVNQTSATFQVFDVSNAATPVAISTLSIGANPRGVYVQGHYAYVMGLTAGILQVIDVSNPTNPVIVGSVATTMNYDVQVQGRYAYLVGNNGLEIVDVANPASPVRVGVVSGFSNPRHLYVQGSYAYVSNEGNATFAVVNISNPASPFIVSTTAAGTNPDGVEVQGRYLYLVNRTSATLQVFDVSNPAVPVSVGSVATVATPWRMSVQGRYLYLVAQSATGVLQVFDISNPATPVSIGSLTISGQAYHVAVEGRYAYLLARTTNTLQVLDVGGSYIQQLETGGIETGALSIRNELQVNNDADIRGGMVVGRGLQVTGPFSVTSSVSGYKTFTINADGHASISGNFGPTTTNAYDLGSNALRWRDLYLASSSLHIGTAGDEAMIDYNVTNDYLAFKPNGTVNQFQLFDTGAASISNALFVTSGGHVGIGTTTPSLSRLAVQNDDDTNNYAFSIFNAAGSQRATFVTVGGAGGLRMYSNGGVEQVNVQATGTSFFNGGNVGINTSIPTARLAISGTASISGAVTMTGLSAANANDEFVCRDPVTGEITFGVTCTASSLKFKKNVEDLGHGLDWVRELRPVTFDWKHNGAPSLGFIAEEVNEITPLLALYQDGEVYSVNYQIMTSVLAKAIQELDGKIASLSTQGPLDLESDGWFDGLFARIVNAFEDLLGIEFGQGSVKADRLCAGSVCVNEQQLQQLLDAAGGSVPEPTDEPEPELTDEPTPTETPESTPEPQQSAEPSPEATPEPEAPSEPSDELSE